MLWFLMVTLPLVLAGIHKLLLMIGIYPKNNSVFIIPAIIICYCIFAVSSAFDRDALPAVLIAIYYIALTVITVRATIRR
ncbi:hypothetical protein GLP30_12750 [Photobacterium phosphoreum]|mgnify:CR=1 FL=1|jgi:hypothetical protein|uniref:Uncharacterized protein n=1 Tax=Photobacterium phosphoreum TaxID=659 RepID=A0A2T3JMW1_PHOPO|nr:hypothetical protein [Photobacterium phosphoreum]KJF85535.1 membrane protein [Photobacterium phosphoreum]MCD9463817.1 hypothetical protein [Photobacterium phosphoreum]MCD9475278.1 hypothetical protein [Photobacterium phosphoreum]MCD9478521.1 hypothetical protein [Photobacterium phosphoreum]MCD9491659.1 hypothetical protein [Photobacterium phosphoreum]